MTKKHFIAMAQYVAQMRRSHGEFESPSWEQVVAVYNFAVWLAATFGERFDRTKFDEYIEKHSLEKKP